MLRSGRRGRDLPLLSGCGAGEAQRPSGDQMAIEIEGVVDGGVRGEKPFAYRADFNRCIFRDWLEKVHSEISIDEAPACPSPPRGQDLACPRRSAAE
jgi:hypothetical protein